MLNLIFFLSVVIALIGDDENIRKPKEINSKNDSATHTDDI